MANSKKPSGRSPSRAKTSSTARKSRNTYTTKSGQTIKLNRNLSQRVKGLKDTWQQHKAIRLAGMPKTHIKRFLYRLKPANLYHYWFSREGAIMALKVFGVGIVVLFILIVGAFAYLRKDLPAINNIYGQNLGGSISYYDSTGKVLLWQDYDAVKRVPVPGDQISNYMKSATVAIEDKNFYHEGAFDVGAILRSAYHDASNSGGGLYGGSTITQQLVKLNENWTDNRTILRKIKEVVLASELEREYSKADILTGYLNIAPYGGVDYGVQTAASDYFNESASQLDLAQSAFLAAIPQAPDYYSPYSPDFDQGALVGREQYILAEMQKQGYITSVQEKTALNENVLAQVKPLQSKYAGIQAPYFVLAAKQQLESQFGQSTVQEGGWKVVTTLNLAQQALAEKVVAADQRTVESYGGDDAAFVSENVPTGQITSMVGGFDFNNPTYGQINFATTLIPPGSSFKLYDYSTLINDNNNVGAGSVLYDIQQPLPGYPCTNKALPLQGGNCLEDYDFRYPGPLTVRYAMAGSRNVPAIKAWLIDGNSSGQSPKTVAVADAMGLTSGYHCYGNVQLTQTAPCYDSAAIGDGAYLRLYQHVNSFATSARLGAYIPETMILKVTNSANKVIYNWTQPKPVQVLKPDTSYIIDNILSDPKASYLPAFQKIQRFQGKYGTWDFGVKTGTQNNNYDGLMMSFSTQYAVGTWVGYHTGDVSMTAGGMEDMTEPMVKGWMDAVHQNLKPVNWTQPSDIKVEPAFVITNHVGLGSVEPSPSTDLYPSWYNVPAKNGKVYTIDIVSGELATSCTPPLAKKTVGSNYNSNIFSIDPFVNGPSTVTTSTSYNTTQNDDIHQCGDQLPAISLQSASITCNGSSCSVGVNVAQGTHPLTSSTYPMKVNAIVDGQSITASCSFSPSIDPNNPPNAATGQCTFPYSGTGTHSVQFQVVDSVLYASTTSAVSIDIPASINATGSGTNVTVSWTSGDQGTGTYTAKLNSGQSCSTTGLSCQITGVAPGNYTVQVTDSSDQDTSPPVSFTVSGQ